MFVEESALEMVNLKYLEHPNKDWVGSCFINGSDPQKREPGLKITVLRAIGLAVVLVDLSPLGMCSLMEEPI